MNELALFDEIDPNSFKSKRLSVVPMIGDSMSPTLHGGRDFAIVAPCDSYEGEGVYAFDRGLGCIELKRFETTLSFKDHSIRMWSDNKTYDDTVVSLEFFEGAVLGKVVAIIKTVDGRMLRKAAS